MRHVEIWSWFDVYVVRTHPTKVIVATALAALSGALYGFAPLFGLDGYHQILLEAVALAATVMTGAVAGIALEVHRISKIQSGRLRSMIDGLLTGAIVIVAWIYVMVQYAGVEEYGIYGAILKAAPLVVLIVIGTMLGIKISIQCGVLSIGDAANMSRNVRHARRITDVALRKLSYGIAHATLGLVVAVAIFTPTDQPTYPVTPDGLFTASATILGFAAFGSALSTLGQSKDLIRSIAYMLIPIILVQAVFMLSLLGHVGFPAAWWISITVILLMLLVLVMFANRIKPAGTDGGTGHLRYF